jgi:RHS repeat-associated protein
MKLTRYKRLAFYLILLLHSSYFVKAQTKIAPSIAYGPSSVSQGEVAIYAVNPGTCTFNNWSFGSGVKSSTSTTSGRIDIIWCSSGTLYAECTCEGGSPTNVSIYVTVTDVPGGGGCTSSPPPPPCPISLTISSTATSISVGDEITLSASGGFNYTWSGTGLLATSGAQVKARPPLGTTSYYVKASDLNATCTKTVGIDVTAAYPPLKQATDVTLCRGSSLQYDLTQQGFSLSEGYWSGPSTASSIGPKITTSLIDASSYANGAYTFTYTRVDNQTTSFKLYILSSRGGTVLFTPDVLADQCTVASGKLLSNSDRDGSIQYWESSTDKGISWYPVTTWGNAVSNIVSAPSEFQYRVAVKNGICPLDYSPPVIVKPLKPTVGPLSPSSISVNCGNANGTLSIKDNFDGDKITWQNDNGTGWIDIPGATSDTYSFNITDNTTYRAKVERTTTICVAAYSDTYTVSIISKGGKPRSVSNEACLTSTADIYLDNYLGDITQWEYSTDNINWAKLNGSEGQNPLPHTTTAPINYYRAQVQLRTCVPAYSEVYTIGVFQPTQAGVVRFTGEEKDAVLINGQYNFYPRFELQNQLGSVQNWFKNESVLFGGADEIINTQTTFLTPVVKTTTAFRAQVKNGGCDALLSGRAVFVVNKLFAGVIRVLDFKIITEYEGNSYKVANGEGLSIQGGFSFYANTAQEFFVLLDDSYSVPAQDQNYVQEETVLKEGVKNDGDVYFLNAAERTSAYNYIDGIGRPMQQVQRKGSPMERDIVKPVAYDQAGRIQMDYLPYVATASDGYFKGNALIDQSQFYLQPDVSQKRVGTVYPYAKRLYENSLLNRVVEQGAPGEDWQPRLGHTIKYSYLVNDRNTVKLWDVGANGMPIAVGKYVEGDLFVRVVIDEHGSEIKEYRDKKDHVVLKQVQNGNQFLETYYLYDDFELLRFVIQPEGVANLNGNPDANFLGKWAFQYKYDGRHRMIEKKVPGAAPVYMVYDERDRLVLAQDGNQRNKNQWSFTKYDALNRPVAMGIYTHGSNIDQAAMGRLISTGLFSESFDGSTSFYGYTNNVFPIANLEVMSVSYYDNYLFRSSFGTGYEYDKDHLAGIPLEESPNTLGLVTGGLTRVLGTTTIMLKKAVYYDDRYRAIQTVMENHFGNTDKQSLRYDFIGRVLNKMTTHSKSGQATTILEEFTYDHASRLLAHYHQINSGPKVLVNQMLYNELGQLVEKNLHAVATGFVQSVDYRYNIRGWLTHINNAALVNDGGVTNDEANDWFGFELKYNNPTPNGGAAQFNGNISEAVWKSLGNSRQSYGYTYDPVNRLKDANYYDLDNPLRTGRFNEQITDYDANGNILGLNRKGKRDETVIAVLYGPMDALGYTYQGNQLMSVTDVTTGTTDKEGGFRDRNTTGNDYQYDANGNMTVDKNKDIASIEYNYLNLPQKVMKTSGNFLTYTYDATGMKLTQQVFRGGAPDKQTDYSSGFVYEDGVLQFLNHDEGRVTMTNSVPEYQYHLKDHLGNVRLTFTSKEETQKDVATFEPDNLANEVGAFLRNEDVRKINSELFNHTPGSTTFYSERLSGIANEQNGLAKSIAVMPGDTVRLEVFAKYVDPVSTNWSTALISLLTSIANGTAAAGTIIDGAGYATSGTAAFPYSALLDKSNGTGLGPKAYLNYIVFDKDFNKIDSKTGFKRLSDQPKENGDNVPHEKLEHEITIDQPGYIYVYLSNDNVALGGDPVEVFFDDFLVKHIKSRIVQSNDYYGFGLTFNSYSRENSVPQNYLYNGKERQDELDLGWDDYGARMYDPSIARWMSIDPLSELSRRWSPYAYAYDNPIRFIDPDGMLNADFREKEWLPSYVGEEPPTNYGSGKDDHGERPRFDDNRRPGLYRDAGSGDIAGPDCPNGDCGSGKDPEIESGGDFQPQGPVNPTGGGIRSDAGGDGHWGAARGSRSGGHQALDLISIDGQAVVAPVSGVVRYTGYTNPYGNWTPMVIITPTDTNLGFQRIELLYVNQSGVEGATVSAGDTVGNSVNLQTLGYPNNVGPHVHVQMFNATGARVDPTSHFFPNN